MEYLDPIVPLDNFDLISDDDDDDMLWRRRAPKLIRPRIDYYNILTEKQFFQRFRLQKLTVMKILNEIYNEIACPSER